MTDLHYMPLIADVLALSVVIVSLISYHVYLHVVERRRPAAVLIFGLLPRIDLTPTPSIEIVEHGADDRSEPSSHKVSGN